MDVTSQLEFFFNLKPSQIEFFDLNAQKFRFLTKSTLKLEILAEDKKLSSFLINSSQKFCKSQKLFQDKKLTMLVERELNASFPCVTHSLDREHFLFLVMFRNVKRVVPRLAVDSRTSSVSRTRVIET